MTGPSETRVKPQPSRSSDPTVAVAFGGGGARGLAHTHIIRALDDMGIRPVAISGSSIGAIMGAAMASGMTGEEISDYTLGLVGNTTDIVARLFRRPASIAAATDRGFRIGQFDVQRIVQNFMPDSVPHEFDRLQIPLSVIATDYYGHHETVFEEGDLWSALAASAAIPALFRPVRRDGRIFIDGGIFNPVPYDHILGKADIVLAIDVVGTPRGDSRRIPRPIDSLYGTSQLMMRSILKLKLKVQPPDVFIQPPVSNFRVMDFLKARQIVEVTAPVYDEVRRKLERALEDRVREPAG
ncbi:patatin-like phospholipase family protein [Oricola sp.]|uniref:patatin-like phospholipase family protein n=1 Tax=Oricola sp. TaxID=1979950 RepID=UPI0025E52395|nr:patatin-like phospholipase family protein [Oricola sp.]MCI5078531.1 patatin-like phospholipase family protein [Oricola sp.]